MKIKNRVMSVMLAVACVSGASVAAAAPAQAASTEWWAYATHSAGGCASVTGAKIGSLVGAGYKMLPKSSSCKKSVQTDGVWYSTNLYYTR
jgi:hypothetical protein